MKLHRTLLALSLFLGIDLAEAQGIKLFGAYFNDNLSGDDFHSYGGIAWAEYAGIQLLAAGSAFTAREQGWRYDLGQLRLRQALDSKRDGLWRLRWGPNGFYKGELVGQDIQNAFHGSTGVGETRLEYDPGRISLGFGLEGEARTQGLWGLGVAAQLQLATEIVPSRLTALIETDLTWNQAWPGTLLVGAGWRQVLHQEEHFSELDRSGPVGMALGELQFWRNLGVQGGLIYRPVSDYKDSGRPTSFEGYASQLWIALTWGRSNREWATLFGLW
jgi:hypothetical protein